MEQLKTIDDRTIVRGGQQIKIAKEDGASAPGLFLHLTTETPRRSSVGGAEGSARGYRGGPDD